MKVSAGWKLADASEETRERLIMWFKMTLRGEIAPDFPVGGGKLVIYIDNVCRRVYSGTWQKDAQILYVGNGYLNEGQIPQGEQLAILGALMTATGLREEPELLEEMARAVARIIVGTYNSALEGLTEASWEIQKVAFSDRDSVAWIDGAWRRVTGEPLTFSDRELSDRPADALEDWLPERWTVCELESKPRPSDVSEESRAGVAVEGGTIVDGFDYAEQLLTESGESTQPDPNLLSSSEMDEISF